MSMPRTIQKIKGLEVSAVIVRTAGSTDTRRSAEQEHQTDTLHGHQTRRRESDLDYLHGRGHFASWLVQYHFLLLGLLLSIL